MATHYIKEIRLYQDMNHATHEVREYAVFAHIGTLGHDPIHPDDEARGLDDINAGKLAAHPENFEHTLAWYSSKWRITEGTLGQILDSLDPEQIAVSGDWSHGPPPPL